MLLVVNLILGASLLTAGRRLFWLFVAAVGFIAGTQLATRTFGSSEWTSLATGIVIGLVFAGLALFFKSLAIGIAGFLGGGTLLLDLAAFVGLDSAPMTWIIFLIGGLIGVALLTQVFDWAIILFSSAGGAGLIIQSLGLENIAGGIGFLVLVGVGAAIQGKVWSEEKKHD